MPDLSTRPQHEDALALLIRQVLDEDRRRFEAGGGFSPSSQALRIKTAVADELAGIFTEAAGQIGAAEKWDMSVSGLSTDARIWANVKADALGRDIATHTMERLGPDADLGSIFGEPRARAIGITETTAAISAGEDWTFQWATTNGLIGRETVTRRWYTERDAQVCEICGPLHRKTEEVWQRMFPQGPPAHPRCRCWLDYEIDHESRN